MPTRHSNSPTLSNIRKSNVRIQNFKNAQVFPKVLDVFNILLFGILTALAYTHTHWLTTWLGVLVNGATCVLYLVRPGFECLRALTGCVVQGWGGWGAGRAGQRSHMHPVPGALGFD